MAAEVVEGHYVVVPTYSKVPVSQQFKEVRNKEEQICSGTEKKHSLLRSFKLSSDHDYAKVLLLIIFTGLGNVGRETPVHSPRRPGRDYLYGSSSPVKAVRKLQSSKNTLRR